VLPKLFWRIWRPKRNSPLPPEPGFEAHLAESVAYSAFIASGVDGVDQVTFHDFVTQLRASPKA
jgi:hypothetical protein